jgi:cytidine deaminase
MSKQKIMSLEDMSADARELLIAARDVANNAYNRYSGFYVGAAVRTKSGAIYTGANLENASYGLTLCAEPTAIANANSNGDFNIVSIAISGGFKNNEKDCPPVTPCGRCRQLIFEASRISETNITVYCSNLELSNILETSIEELLPYAFFF